MGRPKGSKNKNQKNPFESISGFVDEIDALGNDEAALRDRIAKVTLDNAALREAEKADQDLAKCREATKVAFEVYGDGYKAQSMMLDYIRARLAEIGKPNGDSGLDGGDDVKVSMSVGDVQADFSQVELDDAIDRIKKPVQCEAGEDDVTE